MKKKDQKKSQKESIFRVLTPYRSYVAALVLLALAGNGLSLVVPKLISHAIDSYTGGHYALGTTLWVFMVVGLLIFALTYVQGVVQTYASERVARDLRHKLSSKLSEQSFAFVQTTTPSALLTNLTSDIDGIKAFVSQAIVSLISSALLVVGSSVILFSINWKLALAVLAVFPIIAGTFFVVFARVKVLFTKSQEVIDWLNKVINESILGAALIRVLHSQQPEIEKFMAANAEAKAVGMNILRMFAGLIPFIMFMANMAILLILVLGGTFVIRGSMTLGDFAAFNSYVALMIFPIFVIGFMSSVIARASASYARIGAVLSAPVKIETGTCKDTLRGNLAVEHVSLTYKETPVLKDVSFQVQAGSKTAIIGPTAAGKTQLLHVLTGLIEPSEGTISFDGKPMQSYDMECLYAQIGIVFQDSIMFNLSIYENIAFHPNVQEADVQKAIEAAELQDFIGQLPEGLQTIVSERGTTLSGGQKQRIMLARALSLNPNVLLLDDFTARVDGATEAKILANLSRLYPNITLISVTQKISSIEAYDQIILLMEGEVLARGTHQELITSSPEYVQIVNSQRSTSSYDVQSR